jgi:pectate lyase
MFSKLVTLATFAAALVHAAPSPTTAEDYVRRDADAPPFITPRAASCSFPSPPKTSSLSKAMTITGTFDGGNVRFDRGSGACQ